MQNDTTLDTTHPDSATKDKTVRRAQLQAALSPAVEAALKTLPGFDASKPEHQRRLVRALIRIAAQTTMPSGATPDLLLGACVEGIGREVEATLSAPPADFLN